MKTKRILTGILILTLGLSLFTGCKKNEPAADNGPATTPVTTTPEKVNAPENPYKAYIEGYDQAIGHVEVTAAAKSEADQKAAVEAMRQKVRAKAPSLEIFKLYSETIQSLRAPYSDEFAYYALSGLRANSFNDYIQVEPYFTDMSNLDKFFKEYAKNDNSFLMIKRNKAAIEEPKIKELVEQAELQGYLLLSSEGMVFPVVDYTEFAKYKSIFTPAFGALMDQYAYSDVAVPVSDAGLKVTREEILARALEAEKNLNTLEDSKYKRFLALEYQDNLGILLHGTDNSPNFDYETMKITEEVALLYKQIAEMSETKTATYIKMHMAAIEASQGKYDDAVYEKINALKEQVKKDYLVTPQDETDFQNWNSGQVQ